MMMMNTIVTPLWCNWRVFISEYQTKCKVSSFYESCLLAGCVFWNVSVLCWASAERVGDQKSLIFEEFDAVWLNLDLVLIAFLNLHWCQNWTGAISLACFQLIRSSFSCNIGWLMICPYVLGLSCAWCSLILVGCSSQLKLVMEDLGETPSGCVLGW